MTKQITRVIRELKGSLRRYCKGAEAEKEPLIRALKRSSSTSLPLS